MKIHDLSPLLSSRVAVWPGDVPFAREASSSIASGGNIDLSAIRTTLHVGAHADAPSHTVAGALSVDRLPLERFYGPCEVVRVEVGRGARVRPEDLPHAPRAPRLLLATGTFPDPERFDEDFASFGAPLVEWLRRHGVVLVGIDTPSADLFDDEELQAHRALAAAGIAHLEGLLLAGVAPGLYTLCAFPLKLEGADASPVRAVLIED